MAVFTYLAHIFPKSPLPIELSPTHADQGGDKKTIVQGYLADCQS